MSCESDVCRQDIPYPIVSQESVASILGNLTSALYGTITKTVVDGRVVWSTCDVNQQANVFGITRNSGEGLLCYFLRAFQNASVALVPPASSNSQVLASVANNSPEVQWRDYTAAFTGNTFVFRDANGTSNFRRIGITPASGQTLDALTITGLSGQSFVVDENARVGIGGSAQLSLRVNIEAAGDTTGLYVKATGSGTVYGTAIGARGSISVQDGDVDFNIGSSTDKGIIFQDASKQITAALPLNGGGDVSGNKSTALVSLAQNGVGSTLTATNASTSTSPCVSITNAATSVNAHSFIVNDEAGDQTPFVITREGRVGIATTAPASDLYLDVRGKVGFSTNSTGGQILEVNQIGTGSAARFGNSGAAAVTNPCVYIDGNLGTSPALRIDGNASSAKILSVYSGATEILTVSPTGTRLPNTGIAADALTTTRLNVEASGSNLAIYAKGTGTGTTYNNAIGTRGHITLQDGDVIFTSSGKGISFQDSTKQITAALPLAGGGTVTANSTSTALKIIQSGTGDAFRVNDETTDASPFVIDANGNVAIGYDPSIVVKTAKVSIVSGNTDGGLNVNCDYFSTNDCVKIVNGGMGNTLSVNHEAVLTSVTVTNGGSGYLSAPLVQVSGSAGLQASAFATVSGGVVTGVTITNRGNGYIAAPTIIFSPVNGGSGATATCTIGAIYPLVVTSSGLVGIGKSNPQAQLDVVGRAIITGLFEASDIAVNETGGGITFFDNTKQTTAALPLTGGAISGNKSTTLVSITQTGTGNALVVNDQSNDTTPFVIDSQGFVGIKKQTPSVELDVNGLIQATSATSSATISARNSGAAAAIYAENNSTTAEPAVDIYSKGNGRALLVSAAPNVHGIALFQQLNTNGTTVPALTIGVDGVESYVNFICDGLIEASSQGILFSDATTQTTAALPLTGGSVTASNSTRTVAISQNGTGSGLTISNAAASTSPALLVKQLGSGEAFRVDDESPESTPFVIESDGRVCIGYDPSASVPAFTSKLAVVASGSDSGVIVTSGASSSSDCVKIVNSGSGNSLSVHSQGALLTIAITNGGSGYTVAPLVTITGGGGTGATATATVAGGVVTAVNITNRGSGYTSNPVIGFTVVSGGSGAAATSTIGDVNPVVVNASGYVGIMNPNPAVQLDIIGGIAASGMDMNGAATFYSDLFVSQFGVTFTSGNSLKNILSGSVATTATSIASNSQKVYNITVSGAAAGDFVLASCSFSIGSTDTSALLLTASVTDVNTVTVVLNNRTALAYGIPAGTIKAMVFKI